jgi:hypothetical protein
MSMPSPITFSNPFTSGLVGKLVHITGDFNALWKTAVQNNKLIYGVVIASRLGFSRSWNEFCETARRDLLGWYFWFMGGTLLQTTVARCIPNKAIRQAMLTPGWAAQKRGLPKVLAFFFNPNSLCRLTSDKQFEQRIKELGAENAKIYGTAKLWRGGISLLGLIFTVAALGVGINLLNIHCTKANMQKKQGAGAVRPKPSFSDIAPMPVLQPKPVARPAFNNPQPTNPYPTYPTAYYPYMPSMPVVSPYGYRYY